MKPTKQPKEMTNKICGWATSSTGKDGKRTLPSACIDKGCNGFDKHCDHYKDMIEITQCSCIKVVSGKHVFEIKEENKCSDKNCRLILSRFKEIAEFMDGE